MWWRRGTRGIGDRKFPFSGSPQQIFQAGHVASLEGGLLELIEGLGASLVRWAHRPQHRELREEQTNSPLLSPLGERLELREPA